MTNNGVTKEIFEAAKLQSEHTTFLNRASKVLFIGIAAGITRMVLAIFHIIGHLIASINGNKGHLYHAAAGGCEFLRGLIEATPIIGRIFANCYLHPTIEYREDMTVEDLRGNRCWWMMKIYCTEAPDNFDNRYLRLVNSDNYPFFYEIGSVHPEIDEENVDFVHRPEIDVKDAASVKVIQMVRVLPAELESFKDYAQYIGGSYEASKQILIKLINGKLLSPHISKDTLVGHVQAFICANPDYEYASPPRILIKERLCEPTAKLSELGVDDIRIQIIRPPKI